MFITYGNENKIKNPNTVLAQLELDVIIEKNPVPIFFNPAPVVP